MSKRKKILLFTGAFFFGLFLCMLPVPGFIEMLTLKLRFNRLIYKTDHHELLTACRQIMDEGCEGKYDCKWPDKDPEADNFPEIIMDLKPTYLWFNEEGYVSIELFGGMSHYGVRAYTEDFNEPYEKFRYGNKKLIEGLWFDSDFIDLSNVDIQRKRR